MIVWSISEERWSVSSFSKNIKTAATSVTTRLYFPSCFVMVPNGKNNMMLNPAGGGPPGHLPRGGGHLFAPPVSPKLLDGSVKFKRRSIALSNLSRKN